MSDTKKDDPQSNPAKMESVKFLMHRAGQYRSIHADGAWMSLDAYAKLHVSFFHEHPPVPKYAVQKVTPEGNWAKDEIVFEQFSDMKDVNVVREIESEVVLTIEAAKVVRDLLTTFIAMGEDMRQQGAHKK